MKGDIANKKLVKKLIKESDVVVNMAAETHVDRSIANTWLFPHSNTLGALTLFETSKELKKRLGHLSSDEVYERHSRRILYVPKSKDLPRHESQCCWQFL